MIKAFIFDFDGVIADTESLWFETLWDFARRENLGLSLLEMRSHIGDGDTQMMEMLAKALGGRDVLERHYPNLRKNFAQKTETLGPRQGLTDYFDYADAHGIKLACASSSHRPYIEEWLDKLGLSHRFACVVTRSDVASGKPKPAPDIYLQALAKLAVSAGESVAFEDSAMGCAAAEAVGIPCVLVPNQATETTTQNHPNIRLDMAKTPPAKLLAALEKVQ